MIFTIIDCYTDEPSGLGVPPYIGTYPRYIAGAVTETMNQCYYLTIDDLRLLKRGEGKETLKTKINIKNLSKNHNNAEHILERTDVLIVISGVQTPGKYLSALPGTLSEVSDYIKNLRCIKIVTGPAASTGEGLYGGRTASKRYGAFELVVPDIEFKIKSLIENEFSSDVAADTRFLKIAKIANIGAKIVEVHPSYPNFIIAEIETAKGCASGKCSFCTEPLKNKFQLRGVKDIFEEVKALKLAGVEHFRLGKQSDFFSRSHKEIEWLLKNIKHRLKPKVLHIDNIDPCNVTEDKVKSVVKYCTPGNIAALGVESFDEDVARQNNLNSSPDKSMAAIRLINDLGDDRGYNGMHMFLPGINLIFGLIGETKKTHKENMRYLHKIMKEKLLLRRINIREIVAFPGTQLHEEAGMRFFYRNKGYYWKWRRDIREEIDNKMLTRLMPSGTIMTDLRTEVHDGNTTFCRQIGTYPLIVGVKERLELDKFINIAVKDHMLRSLVGKVVE